MSFFAYMTNIPNPPNSPSVDVTTMQSNANAISGILPIDHHGFNDTQGGYHNVIHLTSQIADPAIVAGTGEVYTKTVSAAQELFYRSDSGKVSQLTPIAASATTASANGTTTLPSGIILKWGQVIGPGTSGTISFVGSFTVAPFSITLTLQRNSGNQTATVDSSIIPTTTNFHYLTSSPGSAVLYYFAIGN